MLRYLAMESVMFHSVDDMLVTVWEVIKATTLYKDAIKVRTSPPSTTYVRAYMAVVDGEPLGAQHPTPDEEGNPKHSPCDTTCVGVPHANFRQTLGILQMKNCGSSWRISTGRSLSES